MNHHTSAQKGHMPTWEHCLTLLYLILYLAAALMIAWNQPLNDTYPFLPNPPDEHSRYMVPLYICNHGTLPTGFEEEMFSGECRWTYGFYTLLPYMLQGYVMRFVNLFTDSPLVLLYTARLVNVTLGLIMAYMVLLLGRKLFQDSRTRWIFCFLVTFLPQSLFLHTYVNPDSMCLLSTALILYGLVCGYKDSFSVKSCAFLTIGIILCALSYYNAYGFILGSMVLFTAFYIKPQKKKGIFDLASFLRKGLPICFVVLSCISWSFIRNYLLYDGDIIGLDTMQNFIKSYGIVRDTYASRGDSLAAMLFGTTFFQKLALSFIANYGSTSLYTRRWVYLFYLLILATGIIGMLLIRNDRQEPSPTRRRWLSGLFHGTMVFCIAMPVLLLIRYAYTVDYQAQGRYIMPGLIPLMYYVSRGLEKLACRLRLAEKHKKILAGVLLAGILLCLFSTIHDAMPYYLETTVLPLETP